MCVGLGAVATTFIAGVFAVRKGISSPIGSVTQMGTIRLGKRTDGRSPLVKDFLPLADLNDIVFGGWDIFEEDCYAAAKTAGVLESAQLDQIRGEIDEVLDLRGAAVGALAETDGAHLRERADWQREPLADGEHAGDRGGRNGAETDQQHS